MTVIRAVQWASIVVTGLSLSRPWGDEIAVGKGPPSQYERHVVGAALLLFVAALTMARTARKDGKPGRFALAIAGAASLGAVALALGVRSTAIENQQAHVLLGGGWMWMSAGACMSIGAVVSAFTLLFRPSGDPGSSGAAAESSGKASSRPSNRPGGSKSKQPKRKKR
jgi:hypothetical protein